MKNSDPGLDYLQEWLEAVRQQRELPSLSAAVSIAGEVAWQGACGRMVWGILKIAKQFSKSPNIINNSIN